MRDGERLPLTINGEPDGWREAAAAEARALFKMPMLKEAAGLLAAAHPRALDYIKQAPVLVPNTELQRRKAVRTRNETISMWASRVSKRPKLRDLMGLYNVAYQFRVLDPRILTGARCWTTRLLCTIGTNPSTLAQIIPKYRTHQGQWLSLMNRWYRRMLDRGNLGLHGLGNPLAYAEWAAVAYSKAHTRSGYSWPEDLADFVIAAGARFNTRWDLRQASEACAAWHGELHATAPPGSLPKQFDKPVDYAPFPDEWIGKTDLMCKIVALKTPRALHEEGKAMDHCVFDYWANVWGGASRIFSIRSLLHTGKVLKENMTYVDLTKNDGVIVRAELADGGRIATFELRPGYAAGLPPRAVTWKVGQIQGPNKLRRVPGAAQAIGAFMDDVLKGSHTYVPD